MEETAERVTSRLEADNNLPTLNRAIILGIGNELLIGKVLNTNAHWLSGELTKLGFLVEASLVVRDETIEIARAFRQALSRRPQVVLSTGGLGPTFDDKTAEGLARAVNRPLVLDSRALGLVKRKYEARGMPLTRERIKMAYLPLGSTPLENPVGTAPGIYLKERGTHIFALPGPPGEMEAIFKESVVPLLVRAFKPVNFYEAIAIVRGIPESGFAPVTRKAAEKYKSVYVKSHPRGFEGGSPVLELHLTGFGEKAAEEIAECFEYLIAEAVKMSGTVTVIKKPGTKE